MREPVEDIYKEIGVQLDDLVFYVMTGSDDLGMPEQFKVLLGRYGEDQSRFIYELATIYAENEWL